MPGRPRKPTALHLIEGTGRADRLNPREPAYQVAEPAKPAHILANPVAAEEWDRMIPMLMGQGVMSPAYRTAFEAYCVSYADLVAAETEKATSARYVEEVTVDGAGQEHIKLRPHPALAESRNARKELRQAAQQLGITPATSAKVVAMRTDAPKVGIRAFQARQLAIGAAPAASH